MPHRNANAMSIIMGLCLVSAGGYAGAATNADSVQQAMERGKELFMKATFGGSGRHCNTCHKSGGTVAGELPDGRPIPSLTNAAAIFPRYDKEYQHVKTLQDQIRYCVLNAVKGEPPAYGGPQMTELVTYITSLSEGKPIDMDGKPE